MGLSVWQILIVVVLIVLLFGRGKISELMGDMAKGIKSFKKGLSEEEEPDAKEPPKNITQEKAEAATPAEESKDPQSKDRDSGKAG